MLLTNEKTNRGILKEIEYHLKNYKTYKVAIDNLERQLEYVFPNTTSNYNERIAESNYTKYSRTESYAIKRIESDEAINIRSEKEKYEIILQSIDKSMEIMDETEKAFIKNRYFKKFSIRKTAINMNYTEKHIFSIRKKTLEKLKISLLGILSIH